MNQNETFSWMNQEDNQDQGPGRNKKKPVVPVLPIPPKRPRPEPVYRIQPVPPVIRVRRSDKQS